MLRAVVFLGGAVLMSLEMAGSRILAPVFGSSIYTWGALIVVIMAALTLGYYCGGRLADRFPGYTTMGIILAAAGVFIGFLPFWTRPVNYLCGNLGPRAGSLLAAAAFFFLPGLLLAMISPYAIKIAGRSLTTLGHTAGGLSALSSAGSIAGTLATSFFLIPAMGVRSIVHLLGLLLLGLSLLIFARAGRGEAGTETGKDASGKARCFLLVLLSFAVLIAGLSWRYLPLASGSPDGSPVLYERDSLYQHIIVDQNGSIRHLHFDASYQSALNLDNPLEMVFGYTSVLHLAAVAHPRPARALFIGLGGGSAPAKFLHDYPSLRQVDVAELDPDVIKVARCYFNLPDDPRLRVVHQDGRLFVDQKAREIASGRDLPYDLAVIDAYSASTIPYHLTTLEFFRAVRAVLAPDGVAASNIIGAMAGPQSRLLRAMTRTMRAVFPQVYLFPAGHVSSLADPYEQNVIAIATRRADHWGKARWQRRAREMYAGGLIEENVPEYAQSLIPEEAIRKASWLDGVPLLTDDYAPVDTLQSPLLQTGSKETWRWRRYLWQVMGDGDGG